jgi:exodeoxyribonuclease VII large subunit
MKDLFDIDEETGELQPKIWEVWQLTAHIKQLLTGDEKLAGLTVRGEITNLSRSSAGHIYFGLKDDKAYLKCVAFRSAAQQLTDQPNEGEVALASGRIGLYEAGGNYQLYVDDLILAGKGELYLAFERLKKKLAAEGLFDEARKKPLPEFPRVVGFVTSPSGAAVRDVLRVSGERSPHVRIIISPALVQGETAPQSIIAAIGRLERIGGIDMIIIARGGGSFEDLNCFNDEALVRTIAACRQPTVSAIGHETDFTICDFVADFRAPTPTGAAQMVLPDRDALLEEVDGFLCKTGEIILRAAVAHRRELKNLMGRLALFKPLDKIAQARQRLDEIIARASRALAADIRHMRSELRGAMSRITALDPSAVLGRGYAIAYGPDGKVLTDAKSVTMGDRMSVKLKRGRVDAEIRGIEIWEGARERWI